MSANDILCVDDAPELLALMSRALGSDYHVLTAKNPGDAISLAFADPLAELILLDVDMPEVSGFELCRALKAQTLTAASIGTAQAVPRGLSARRSPGRGA